MATDRTLNSTGGLVSILREFSRSVEKLTNTVLFPVRLQDLDDLEQTEKSEIAEIIKHCFNEKNQEANLYELYLLLLNTRSELLTGTDVNGLPASGNTTFHSDLKRMAHMLKMLTGLSDSVRHCYEDSIAPSRLT